MVRTGRIYLLSRAGMGGLAHLARGMQTFLTVFFVGVVRFLLLFFWEGASIPLMKSGCNSEWFRDEDVGCVKKRAWLLGCAR